MEVYPLDNRLLMGVPFYFNWFDGLLAEHL